VVWDVEVKTEPWFRIWFHFAVFRENWNLGRNHLSTSEASIFYDQVTCGFRIRQHSDTDPAGTPVISLVARNPCRHTSGSALSNPMTNNLALPCFGRQLATSWLLFPQTDTHSAGFDDGDGACELA
jgi:hypothetical protein